MKVFGIAGGSGSGKSTACYALVDSNPDQYKVLNFDDYHKLSTDANLPMLAGMINWDHPDVIDWDALIADINKLKNGQEVTIQTWAHRSNPDYARTHQRISRTIKPPPILLVEGNLILHNPELVELFDKTFYLDLNDGSRNARRDKNEIIGQSDYVEKVLNPMYKQYVEPSKQNADVIIDVSNQTVEQIKLKIVQELRDT